MPGPCGRCGHYVGAAEERLALGKSWHLECFTCAICNKGLDSLTLAEYKELDDVYCRSCYRKFIGLQGYGYGPNGPTLVIYDVPEEYQHTGETDQSSQKWEQPPTRLGKVFLKTRAIPHHYGHAGLIGASSALTRSLGQESRDAQSIGSRSSRGSARAAQESAGVIAKSSQNSTKPVSASAVATKSNSQENPSPQSIGSRSSRGSARAAQESSEVIAKSSQNRTKPISASAVATKSNSQENPSPEINSNWSFKTPPPPTSRPLSKLSSSSRGNSKPSTPVPSPGASNTSQLIPPPPPPPPKNNSSSRGSSRTPTPLPSPGSNNSWQPITPPFSKLESSSRGNNSRPSTPIPSPGSNNSWSIPPPPPSPNKGNSRPPTPIPSTGSSQNRPLPPPPPPPPPKNNSSSRGIGIMPVPISSSRNSQSRPLPPPPPPSSPSPRISNNSQPVVMSKLPSLRSTSRSESGSRSAEPVNQNIASTTTTATMNRTTFNVEVTPSGPGVTPNSTTDTTDSNCPPLFFCGGKCVGTPSTPRYPPGPADARRMALGPNYGAVRTVPKGLGEPCRRCGRPVFHTELQLGYHGAYHTECFKCCSCGKKLDSTSVSEHQGEIFCKGCYRRNFAVHGVGFGIGAGALQTP